MAMQGVRKVFFVGPDRNDPTCKVATMELTCGCKVTQSIKGSWLRELSEAGYVVDGEVACPKGHELPSPPSSIARSAGAAEHPSRAPGRRASGRRARLRQPPLHLVAAANAPSLHRARDPLGSGARLLPSG